MRRVMIIGQPGSGKSTLARAMGEITHLPVVHMDRIQWRPGWVETDRAERTERTLAIHRRPTWIFEGGHSQTWPDRLAHADTLIWLDLGIGLRLRRVTLRSLRWLGRTRPDIQDACPERISPGFYRYIWRTRHSSRARMRATFDDAGPDVARHHLQSPRAVATYLDALRRAVAVGNLGIPHR
ncbi:AAA family ATPase [Jannaschia sp. S6380]|uniref:AAA family ATPase n=1 Tax=Jannaschia sp. S6380 TaxID=2926408 RepID=UPI001FF33D05|nr:AAA family ATPase [Jannaschia sp. S6380]MCK0167557.1 AAA family ATPase [Jannaschia sp. S6380]